MAHEQVDFPTADDLFSFLNWGGYKDPTEVALDADGTMVVLRVSLKGDRVGQSTIMRNSLGIEVYALTLRDQPIPRSLLADRTMGTIALEVHNTGAE